jgi:nucleoside 2-deoxyribosyltransferase
MKVKTYKNGKNGFTAYLKDLGTGWEAGFSNGSNKPIFVGNFIHASEANEWYTLMNDEITKFNKKFTVGSNCPSQWYTTFMGAHLYKHYYNFINRVLTQHSRRYEQFVERETRKYRQLSKNWYPGEKAPFLKAS